jgi:hypothetical protein
MWPTNYVLGWISPTGEPILRSRPLALGLTVEEARPETERDLEAVSGLTTVNHTWTVETLSGITGGPDSIGLPHYQAFRGPILTHGFTSAPISCPRRNIIMIFAASKAIGLFIVQSSLSSVSEAPFPALRA